MRNCAYLLLLIFLTFESALAQKASVPDSTKNSSSDFAINLSNYIQNYPEEKIHVHFDRDNYQIGDTVWFKVYIVNSYNNQLSALSKIVHITITNDGGFSQKILLPVYTGMADGYLALSADKYKSGNYNFKAFTGIMAANGKKYSSFNLPIGLPSNTTNSISNNYRASKEIDLYGFFPEGGELVAGLKSKVVIKSADTQTNPKLAQGYIVDNKNTKVAVFSIGKSGMGLFALTPQKGLTYSAILENDVPGRNFPLPKVLDSGYVLALNTIVNDTLPIRISKLGIAAIDVRLLFQANGNIINTVNVSLSSGSAIVKVPTVTLTAGLNEIALFSMNNELLANRFLFVPERKFSSNTLSLDKSEYGRLDKVKLKLNATDSDEAGLIGGYSISVSKSDSLHKDLPTPRNILSSLNLNLDTAKNNYHEFSFDGENSMDKSDIDLQLLTQRKGNFSWVDVLAINQKKPVTNVEQGLSINGTVFNSQGKPMAGAKLNLFAPNEMIIIDTVANAQGKFVFQNFSIMDSADVIIRVKNLGSEKNVTIVLDEQLSSIAPTIKDSSAFDTTVIKKDDQSNPSKPEPTTNDKNNTLKTVEIKARKRPEIKGSVYPLATAPPDYTLDAEQLEKVVDLTDYLRSRFNGVIIKNNIVIGQSRDPKGPKEGPMLILLNGLKIEDLSSIIPSTLTGVQILKGGMAAAGMSSQFGGASEFGIIFLTSDRQSTSLSQRPQQKTGIINTKILGLQSPKDFSPPINFSKAGISKDNHTTLFWKPDIITKENGIAELEFNTSDQPGKYQIIAEGIGITGQIFRKVIYFTVK